MEQYLIWVYLGHSPISLKCLALCDPLCDQSSFAHVTGSGEASACLLPFTSLAPLHSALSAHLFGAWPPSPHTWLPGLSFPVISWVSRSPPPHPALGVHCGRWHKYRRLFGQLRFSFRLWAPGRLGSCLSQSLSTPPRVCAHTSFQSKSASFLHCQLPISNFVEICLLCVISFLLPTCN